MSQKSGGVRTVNAKGARILVKFEVNSVLVSSEMAPPRVDGAGFTFTMTSPPLVLVLGIQHPPLNKESDIYLSFMNKIKTSETMSNTKTVFLSGFVSCVG